MRFPGFRCPYCWHPFHSAAAVKNHTHATQMKCFDDQPLWKRNRIISYRVMHNITPPGIPKDPDDDFEVIE